ncbi:MAG: hypothetical protein AUI14_22175 [Actinobacteria bacterium 13_2_20CM_2_71_6]|nr:MAG: hypothetical protein AUI14_22175 [Actinobacteria bacterium 13_2_20CM_2_71_6]
MNVNIEEVVATFPNVEPFPGLGGAWKWSPSPRFTFALAKDVNGERAFQVNCIDSFDEGLVRSVLEFSRTHKVADAATGPLALVPGFRYEPYRFHAVASASPTVHGYHAGRKDGFNDIVIAVFPAYECEVSGTETVEEARHRFKRMLHPTVMSRDPAPYLRMRYENTRTGAGSIGPSRGFTTPDVLLRELELLEDAPGSYVEFENFRGEVRKVEWRQGTWVVEGARSETLRRDDLAAWVDSVLGCSS